MNGRNEIVITQYRDRPILLYQSENKLYDLVVGERQQEEAPQVGDIYVGRVQNIVQNIRAVFVEIKEGVICYLPGTECAGKKIRVGDDLVVQVKKAAVKTKQPVVTQAIELVGYYCVVTTENSRKQISKKIEEEEKKRLQPLLEEFTEEEYGIVLRTNAAEAGLAAVREECDRLTGEMHSMMEHSRYRVCFSRLRKADPFYMPYIRSCRQEEYDRIITDIRTVYDDLLEQGVDKVQLYDDSSYPLEKLLGIGTKIEKVSEKRVWLKSGGNLVIEPTEALTVIDVNTGKAVDGKRSRETTFFKINCEAAKEVARQIRVRNISGIILVDFIDMKNKQNERQLFDLLQGELQKDKTRTSLIDITKLGLAEITRMKTRAPLWEAFGN